ncbi:hypothetical protein CYMTET_56403 [Cymbomonas tetramitiformis]|uniref:Uncharacterized protein n=1 Tax=Cymbomonas tetramitiformis TaxID=36881 RepID=A0AAE0BCG6_9CHLO|nr:hypothetical protein CYMTET_56403 [Cymbomonas tetramitiformis]
MASCRQRARISAVASALHVIRRRELTHGYDLVVSGGAHAPDTKIESINHIVNMSFDHYELTPQHPPLFPPPCVPLGHCLVVFADVHYGIKQQNVDDLNVIFETNSYENGELNFKATVRGGRGASSLRCHQCGL